jgi:hypothetical protein
MLFYNKKTAPKLGRMFFPRYHPYWLELSSPAQSVFNGTGAGLFSLVSRGWDEGKGMLESLSPYYFLAFLLLFGSYSRHQQL